MSNLLIIAGVAGLALVLFGCARGETVTGERARALVAEGATLLDVRTPGEYASGHADGALNIPIGELAGRLQEVPADRPVVVYCASGVRSAKAAGQLRKAGRDAHNAGGLRDYQK